MGPLEARLARAVEFLNKGWTKFVNARDAAGQYRGAWEPEAVCWCATGAVVAAGPSNDDSYNGVVGLLIEVRGLTVTRDWLYNTQQVQNINDKYIYSQAEAISWFQKARALAHERGL